jgi:hypothetical protein
MLIMPMKFVLSFFSILALSCASLSAQVIVNEVVTSNSAYLDEDGDSPDWLELHNTGTETVDLSGYHLSDQANQPRKWRISSLELGAGAYALIWASDKDRSSASTFRTLVNRGDLFRYLVPTGPVPAGWVDNNFNDAAWSSGPSGFGYGDGDDATNLPSGTISVFLRRTFNVDNPGDVEALYFDIDYDDGFVAYLNGTEIARANMEGERPGWDALATDFLEPRIVFEAAPVRYLVPDPATLLRSGENVLSIQGHNVNEFSSDLTFIPFLTASFRGISQQGVPPPAVLSLPAGANLHTNFRLSAEGETVYLNDRDGNPVDNLPAIGLPANHSVGIPGNGGLARFFRATTPGAANPNDGFEGVIGDRVSFSHPGGLTGPLTVSLRGASAGNVIHYTLDATEPTTLSPVYNQPIPVDANQVIRAAIFRAAYLPSPVATATYLIGPDHDLPVVSLVTEPDNFFHPVTGMYVLGEGYEGGFPFFGSNIWKDTEHPVSFTLYEPEVQTRFNFDGGVKIFGAYSRGQDQRSFSIFARGRYGASEMEYPFFPERDYDKFQALVIRNSGNDNTITQLRDAVLTSLMAGSALDFQANRPVATYINGEYWGLYNLREKVNEHFLASLHNIEADDVDIVELNGQAIHGSADEYNALVDYIRTNPISQDVHYNYVADRIDLDNYIQYQAAQIYFDNRDWPGNNIKYWKHRQGKWRWILFDTDFGAAIWDANAAEVNTLAFALNAFGPNWPNPPWSTLLFRRMITNEAFRHRFINQLADEMNSRFLPTPVTRHINQRADVVASEMPRQAERWGQVSGNWNAQVERMRDFFRRRPARMKDFVQQQFNLPAVHRLRISILDTEQGYVQVNSLTIEDNSWGGDYFQEVPIRVTAISREGYQFARWELDATSTEAELELDMASALTLRPVFVDRTTSVTEPGAKLSSVTNLKFSPNPSDGHLRLAFTVRATTALTATLHDALGREVRRFFATTFGAGPQVQSFDVTALVAGAYYIHLSEQNGGTAVMKWVLR